MTFYEAIKICFSKYAEGSGRARRAEFWYFQLFCMVAAIVATIIDGMIGQVVWTPTTWIVTIITLAPSIAVGVRRLHDVGQSGWWILLVFTVIGIIALLPWWCTKGDEGVNRFGPNPIPKPVET